MTSPWNRRWSWRRRCRERFGNRIYFKREDMQSVFSFKLRGAYNKMAHLPPAQLKRGVICASAGNHAQGVALSASRLGCRAVIVMPTTTPSVKVEAVKARGGANVDVVLYGDSYSDAYQHALALEKKLKLTFVHPFDDPDVIAGQGTIGMEILRQHAGPIHAIFVADRRRRPDRRRRRLRQGRASGYQDHRRADHRFRRHGAQPRRPAGA